MPSASSDRTSNSAGPDCGSRPAPGRGSAYVRCASVSVAAPSEPAPTISNGAHINSRAQHDEPSAESLPSSRPSGQHPRAGDQLACASSNSSPGPASEARRHLRTGCRDRSQPPWTPEGQPAIQARPHQAILRPAIFRPGNSFSSRVPAGDRAQRLHGKRANEQTERISSRKQCAMNQSLCEANAKLRLF